MTIHVAARTRGTSAARLGLTAAVLVLAMLAALRFWLHDAFPYLVDYSEAAYRRYWAVRFGLLPHIAGGSIALLTGPLQLWSGFQRRYRRLHRLTGYAYVTAVALSDVSSFYLSLHTLPDFGLSLAVLASAWLASTTMALIAIRNRRIDTHREWMVRSYIATFAFVSYRYLVDVSIFGFLQASRPAMVLWISWVVPMMVFELWVQRERVRPLKRPARPAVPGESETEAWS